MRTISLYISLHLLLICNVASLRAQEQYEVYTTIPQCITQVVEVYQPTANTTQYNVTNYYYGYNTTIDRRYIYTVPPNSVTGIYSANTSPNQIEYIRTTEEDQMLQYLNDYLSSMGFLPLLPEAWQLLIGTLGGLLTMLIAWISRKAFILIVISIRRLRHTTSLS